jgi:ankyrin repeat protein
MIKAGADVNQAQPDGTRPIHWAVYRVDHELVDALIARKARVDVANEFGHTPLAEAVRQGDARIVKTLLDAGSGTEAPNPDGQTALMVANQERRAAGVSVTHRRRCQGQRRRERSGADAVDVGGGGNPQCGRDGEGCSSPRAPM